MKRLINAVLLRLEWGFKIFLFYFFRMFPIKNNKVVITSYFGKGYGDNAKYIAEELLKEEKFDIVWLLGDLSDELPNAIRKVKYDSFAAIYELATAKIWIDNCRKPIYARKRFNQYYIQTWHGDIGNKRVENDANDSLYNSYIKMAKRDSKMADLFVSGNQWMTEKYRTSFWYEGEVAKCGYPRRDILYSDTEKIWFFKKKLGVSEDSKICLYAPTFRKANNGIIDLSVYDVDWDSVLNALKQRFGGEWTILIRLHPNISQYSKQLSIPNKAMNVTDYPDMQELMAVSDICITDYSSSVYDFAVTKKPGFIFAKDLSDYLKDRGTYFDFSDTPFVVAETNEALIEAISNFDFVEYEEKHEHFYRDILGMYSEGNASEYICGVIKGIV